MEDSIEKAVKRAIVAMRENLGEDLTVDDLARAAMFSKFHFTRIFQRTTGVSPGRFLSALRLHQAKHLLVSTSLNVSDISMTVGYKSVGTFSSRFSRSVGMSPTTYRRRSGFAPVIPTAARNRPGQCQGRVYGDIVAAEGQPPGLVFAGLFPERIPEGKPVRCTILPGAGAFDFGAVPPGSWYLLAQSVGGGPEADVRAACRDDVAISVATNGPLIIRDDTVVRADLALQPVRDLDPPVLLAMLDVRKLALETLAEQERTSVVSPLVTASGRVRPFDRETRKDTAA